MKFLLLFILFVNLANASNLSGRIKHDNYEVAEESENQLMFSIESVKAGLFSSTHVGYVKSFDYNVDLSKKKLKNMRISFDVKEMDTDNSIRDEKLHNECMKINEHPRLIIEIIDEVEISELEKGKKIEGKVKILGKEKRFIAQISGELEEDELEVNVESVWGFKEMEIPDPSILIAKVKNEIQIKLNLEIKVKDDK